MLGPSLYFDASRACPENVKLWFKQHPKNIKPADPENCTFLNQKAKITAALAASTSKESFAKNLQGILQLLEEEETENSKQKTASPSPSISSSEDFYQNEDDCFGVNLAED